MADENKPTGDAPAGSGTPAPKSEPTILVPPTPAPVAAKPEPAPAAEKPLTRAEIAAIVAEAVKATQSTPAEAPKKDDSKPDSDGAKALAEIQKMQRNAALTKALDDAKVTDQKARELLEKSASDVPLEKIAEHITASAALFAKAEVPRVVTPDGGAPNGGGPTNDLLGANPMTWPKGTAGRFVDSGKLAELRDRVESWAFRGSHVNQYAAAKKRRA